MSTKPAEIIKKNLTDTISAINKTYGAGTIMKLGESRPAFDIQVIPTQSMRLNLALGVGGLPRGRVIEVYGPEGGGKSGLCLGVCAEAQKLGGQVAYIDVECALDPVYAETIGVDLESLYYAQPSSAEQALEIADELIKTGEIDVLVIDSVAALVPLVELEGEMGDQQMGLQARLMSKALRKLTASIAKTKTCCVFINQIREKIGVMYGNPEVTTGGRALRFYSSVRIEVRRGDFIKKGEKILGHIVKTSIKKNKVAPPHKTAEYAVYYGVGIDVMDEIANLAISEGVIKKAGAWLSYIDEAGNIMERIEPCKWQGIEKFKEALRDNSEFYQEIHDLTMGKISKAPTITAC